MAMGINEQGLYSAVKALSVSRQSPDPSVRLSRQATVAISRQVKQVNPQGMRSMQHCIDGV